METLAGAWALILWAVLVMIVSVIRRRPLHPGRRAPDPAWSAGGARGGRPRDRRGCAGRWGVARPLQAFGLLLAGPIFCLVMAAGSLATELLVRPVAAPRRRATLAARHFPSTSTGRS